MEFSNDPAKLVKNLASKLAPGGKLLVIVPSSQALYCNMDRTLGHKRRFDKGELGGLIADVGLDVTSIQRFNSMAYAAWFVNGKLFGSQRLNRFTLKLFDKTVWIWRRLDPILPWPGLRVAACRRHATLSMRALRLDFEARPLAVTDHAEPAAPGWGEVRLRLY